jgi:hypothetical protein
MERLAQALAEVRSCCPEAVRLPMEWLTIKHPLHPVQERLLRFRVPARRPLSSLGLALRWAVQAPVLVLYAGVFFARLVWLKFRLRRSLQALKAKPFDLIAKTWSFDEVLSPRVSDFYFGDLQERLGSRRIRLLMLTGNPSGMGWRGFLFARARVEGHPHLPELCLVPLLAPLRMAALQFQAAWGLAGLARRSPDPLVREAAGLAARAGLSCENLPLGLYFWIGRRAVQLWRPKAFLTLYEGYPWEESLWNGAKSADPGCRSVGYQHTVLMRHNLALLNGGAGSGPAGTKPDLVLCLGPRTESMLRSSHSRSTLVTFGSFRRLPSPPAALPHPERRTVLVAPEGYWGETLFLFGAAARLARRLPDHRFLLRMHPVLPRPRVWRLLTKQEGRLPENLRMSDQGAIESDIDQASVILYRGSSSVLPAILRGLKPFYLHDEAWPEVDPVFELGGWRERVSGVGELEAALVRYAREEAGALEPVWKEAADYVNDYVVGVSSDSIDRMLEAACGGLKGQERCAV